MWTVAPQIKTIEQPVQLLDRQHDGFVGVIGRCFEAFGFKAFESKAKAIAFPAGEDLSKNAYDQYFLSIA